MAKADRDHALLAPAVPKRRCYQQEPVLLLLFQLYPPDGKVPDRVPTETVRQRVLAELARENEELILRGIPPIPGPSWETVHRALGRDKRRRE
jgi:hypothetical protein